MELPIYQIDAFTTRLFGGELFCEPRDARVLMAGTITVDGVAQETP